MGLRLGWELHLHVGLLQNVGKALQILVALDELGLLDFAGRDQQEKVCRALVGFVERNFARRHLGLRRVHALINVGDAERGQLGSRRQAGVFGEQRQHVVVDGIVALAALIGDVAQMLGLVA